ncbi:NRDE family protein [Psychrobacter sp. I-STPA10]|uniref:NRDE family protein n=1 Tax=Psychrobacter sp. I-STPA10 TaxID=2585769 RepID=UPI001E53FEE5|nr:NRDE family protein [Psychrobacter sp. I-STPA10]
MCIVALAWQLFADMPVVLLSNRDEFLDRPTQPAHQWQDASIFAGRDKKSGGTWLGYQQSNLGGQNQQGEQNGRWAAVLNFRDGVQATPEQISRGELVKQFLISTLSPLAFARQIDLQQYAGFNLIIGDTQQAVVVNNRGYPPTPLHTGLHIISNGQPDSGWYKCEHLRGRVRQELLPLIAENSDIDYWQSIAFEILSDTRAAPSDQLPTTTNMPTQLEQALSAICIDDATLPNYGTRTQSILTIANKCSNDILPSTDEVNHQASLSSREYQPINH